MVSPPKYLTPADVSQRLNGRISVKTLANWRSQLKGPAFRRMGGRILYPEDQFEAWAMQQDKSGSRQALESPTSPPHSEVREQPAPWELDPTEPADDEDGFTPAYRWLRRQRKSWKPVNITSVELLNLVYEDYKF